MEEWRDIKDYENSYQVSNLGRVRSKDRMVKTNKGYRPLKGQILKGEINKYGYVNYRLWKDNKLKNMLGHRLVCIVFLPNPDCKKEVNHKNGIKNDNRLENLEWSTRSENTTHALETRLQRANTSKLTEELFIEIENKRKNGEVLKHVLGCFGINRNSFYYRKRHGFAFDSRGYKKETK